MFYATQAFSVMTCKTRLWNQFYDKCNIDLKRTISKEKHGREYQKRLELIMIIILFIHKRLMYRRLIFGKIRYKHHIPANVNKTLRLILM